ncbi:MAG: cytochrome c biogenesis protein CcsA [Verrucomicrobiales bacterium]|nr:cytochrome c biogenesis protein CcsA [Verrucomicrobiales bacterium]
MNSLIKSLRVNLLFAFAATLTFSAAGIESYQKWDPKIVETFEAMPVQEEGRLKPMQTVARYKLMRINNSKRLRFEVGGEKVKVSAAEWLMDCLFRPEVAKKLPIFKVNNPDVIEAIGVTPHNSPRERYSYEEISSVPDAMKLLSERTGELGKIMEDSDKEEEGKEARRDPVNAGLLSLKSAVNEFEWSVNAFNFARDGIAVDLGEASEDFKKAEGGRSKVSYFLSEFDKIIEIARKPDGQEFVAKISAAFNILERDVATAGVKDRVSMISLAMFPPISDDDEEWIKPGYLIEQLSFRKNELSTEEQKTFAQWALPKIKALEGLTRNVGSPSFGVDLKALSDGIVKKAKERGEYKNIELELLNNRLGLFHWALPFYIMAFILLAVTWLGPGSNVSRVLTHGVVVMTVFATIALIAGICLRSILLGRPPISTLYETIPFITASAVILCLIIEFFDRKGIALACSAMIGIIGLFLAMRFEIKEAQDTLKVLEAVLRSNFWLGTHVICINIGYSAAILGGVIAHLFIFSCFLNVGSKDYRKSVTRMVYGVTCFGLLFALVGTVLGGVWANDSWGRFWGWDPKENGALMICIGAIILLHARMGGYIKELGINVMAVLILMITVFSWWHVNQLETGLHSYGFTSGIMFWLFIVYAIESAVMALGLSCYFFRFPERKARIAAYRLGLADVFPVSFFLLAFCFTIIFVKLALRA